MALFVGDSGDNTFAGGDADDYVDVSQGGNDTVSGGGGSDNFIFGAAYTVDDQVDGGDGTDYLQLQGDYAKGLVFTAASMANIDVLMLSDASSGIPTYFYNLTFVDANVTAGHRFTIQANAAAQIDGSAETDGVFLVESQVSALAFTGGAGDDEVQLLTTAMSSLTHFDGGAGQDILRLAVGTTLDLRHANMANVETLALGASRGNFDLSVRDTVVAAGQQLTVDGGALQVGETLAFDGFKERDGAFHLLGGAGGDTLTGGHGADSISGAGGDDLIKGGAGGDTLTGGAGSDTFVYDKIGESLVRHPDHITDLAAGDTIDLSGMDADTTTGGNQSFALVLQFDGHAGEAVLSYDSGADTTRLSLDVDGDGKAESIILITGDQTGFTGFVL